MPYSNPTQAGLDLLYQAYYSGRTMVDLGDKTVKYASMSDLWLAIQRYEALLNAATTPPRYCRIRAGKGL